MAPRAVAERAARAPKPPEGRMSRGIESELAALSLSEGNSDDEVGPTPWLPCWCSAVLREPTAEATGVVVAMAHRRVMLTVAGADAQGHHPVDRGRRSMPLVSRPSHARSPAKAHRRALIIRERGRLDPD
jgi:hypothetical protein